MFDNEFEIFYRQSRDNSWPDIREYQEFLRLPSYIQNECFNLHRLQDRLDEICDYDHWCKIINYVCVSGDLAFVPLAKCASTYYVNKLLEQGWELKLIKDIDLEGTHFFGLIMHPLKRYLKGLTQTIVSSHDRLGYSSPWQNHWHQTWDIDWGGVEETLGSKYFLNFVSRISVTDIHTIPYHVILGSLIHKIHWIPMDPFSDKEIKLSVMDYCKKYQQNVVFPLQDDRIHKSNPIQIKLHDTITNLYLSGKINKYDLYRIFAPDFKLYYQVLNQSLTRPKKASTS